MRPIVLRSLIALGGVVGGGTIVATADVINDDKWLIQAHIVEYVDPACLAVGSAAKDSASLWHTGSAQKKATQAQKRARATLDSLLAEQCVIHRQRIDTTLKDALPDTVTEPDTAVQPDTLPTEPEPDTLPTEPDTTTVPDGTGPAPQDTTARILALIGPTLTPDSASSLGGGYALYDPLWVKWETTRWAADSSQWGGNYYDRGQAYYAMCIRQHHPLYCQRGDAIVLDYRRNYLHKNNYQASSHWSQLDGVALHYWLTGDDSSRIAVGKTAWNLAPTITWPRTGNYTDGRSHARALVGVLLAWQMNAPNAPPLGWAKTLDAGLDAILSQQSPDGAWRFPVNTCDLSLNYMGAMLADALIRVYMTYRPDPRIPAAVSKTADFLTTQWRPNDAVPSFNYYEKLCVNQHGTGGPTATPDLTGLYAPMYAWMARQDSRYRPMADAVFLATMQGIYPQGAKQFNQAFYGTWRALGYLP